MNKLYDLSEKIDLILQNKSTTENYEELTQEIKTIVKDFKQGSLGLAQINPIAGDIEYNAKKIMKYINYAQEVELDAVVFPELALMGYPIEDTIDRHPVIVEENIKWLKEIAKLTQNITAIIGFVEPRKNTTSKGKNYYNSLAIISDGKIQGIVRKSLLPTYSEFNDYRYIEPSPVVGVQPAETLCHFDMDNIKDCDKTNEINGIKYGLSICEDCWNNKNFFSSIMYEIDPIDELAEENPQVFINCSASPSRAKKEQLKHNMLSFVAKDYETPIVYVNQVGAIDNCSFDGSSRVFDKNGNLIARAKCLKNSS